MNYSQMLKKIRREFPTLKWKNYRCLNQGFDHLVIILDDKIVFRSPKSSPESSHNEKNELFLESKLLAYLRKKLTIQIPVYIYISRDKSLAGYKLVPGAELTAKNFAQLSLEQQASVASQLANFLTTLHRSPKEIAINYRIKTDRPRQEFIILKRNIKQYLFPKLKSSEKKIISDYLSELELSLKNKYSKVLIHNDLTAEHILWDERKQAINIIDFSDRAWGDPATDFAGLWDYGEKFVNQVKNLYRGPADKQLLDRSLLYYKRIPIFIMQDSLRGYPCSFQKGYQIFKYRFNIKP